MKMTTNGWRMTAAVFLCAAMAGAAGAAKMVGGTVSLYDTGSPATIAPKSAELVQDGWKKAAAGAGIQGDAVLVNGIVAAVIRADGSGFDLYAAASDGWTLRGRVVPVAGGKPVKMQGLKAEGIEAVKAAVAVDLGLGNGLVLSVKAGLPILEATAKGKPERLRIEAPCRFGVLPDFFADDVVVDARDIAVDRTEIPSDNFFLHMLGDGEAILAALWEKNVRDIELTLKGSGDGRTIACSEIFFGDQGSIWTAVLEGKGIWYTTDLTPDDSKKGKEIEDWTVPFMAKWKSNVTLEGGSIFSSPIVDAKGAKSFAGMRYPFHNHQLKRSKSGAKGTYAVTLLAQSKLMPMIKGTHVAVWNGPLVAYPLSRYQTPPEKKCIDDLMRECLGVDACGYVLDTENRSPEYRGIFTCSFGKTPGMFIPGVPAFDRDRATAETWKDDRAFMRRETKAVMTFITFIQDRINAYLDLRLDLLAYLDEAKAKHPGQADFIARLKKEMDKPASTLKGEVAPDVRADGKDVFQPWMDDMMKAMATDTPEQAKKGWAAAEAPSIGDPQDARVASLRRQVKQWRSMATMEMARNPKVAEIAKEIRKRTEAALRNPSNYERETVW